MSSLEAVVSLAWSDLPPAPWNLKTKTPITLQLLETGAALLDQRQLPHAVAYLLIQTPEAMISAIQTMVVRGASAIGIAGAYGLVLSGRLAVQQSTSLSE